MGELKRLQCLDQQLHTLNIEINQKLDKDRAGFSTCNSRLVAAVHACINIMVCSLLYACPMCTYIPLKACNLLTLVHKQTVNYNTLKFQLNFKAFLI